MADEPAGSGSPMIDSPFDAEAALRRDLFDQEPLIDADGFLAHLEARDLASRHAAPPLEDLDRLGRLCPVAYALVPDWNWNQAAKVTAGAIVVRANSGFLPWQTQLGDGVGVPHPERVCIPLYSPWQTFRFVGFRAAVHAAPDWWILTDADDPGVTPDQREFLVGFARRRADSEARRWERIENLLYRAQDQYAAFARSSTHRYRVRTGHTSGDPEVQDNRIYERRLAFSAHDAAAECGITADELTRLSIELWATADTTDPNRSILRVLDRLSLSARERLKGPALLATDYRTAARVFAHWATALEPTGELRDPDPLQDHPGRSILRQSPNARRDEVGLYDALNNVGLYPWKAHVFCEGAVEVDVLRDLFNRELGLAPERCGVRFTDLSGGNIAVPKDRDKRRWHLTLWTVLIGVFRPYVSHIIVILDDENDARELRKALISAGTISDRNDEWGDAFIARQGNFDESNFTVGELRTAIVRTVQELGPSWRISEAGLDDAAAEPNSPTSLADARRPRAGLLNRLIRAGVIPPDGAKFEKSLLSQALADIIWHTPQREDGDDRPVWTLLTRIVASLDTGTPEHDNAVDRLRTQTRTV